MGVLYEHWRPDTNECFYVGASWKNPETRPYEMSDRNDDHLRIQEELAAKGLSPEVKVIDCSWLLDEELGELESLQIAYWKDFIGDRLVNRAKGGEGFNIDWDADMRERHRVWRKNFISSEDGKVWSENHSEFMDGYWNGERGEENRSAHSNLLVEFYSTEKGRKIIEETRPKNSAGLKAFASTEEGKKSYKDRGGKIKEIRNTVDWLTKNEGFSSKISLSVFEYAKTENGKNDYSNRGEKIGASLSSYFKSPAGRQQAILHSWWLSNVKNKPYWGC